MLLGQHKAPPIHAAQHERAGRKGDDHTRPALPLAGSVLAPASGYGHLTRSRPQDSASNAAVPQWEPRKPLAGTRKPRREAEDSSGAKVGHGHRNEVWSVVGPHTRLDPSDQLRKRILHKKGPSAKPGPGAETGCSASHGVASPQLSFFLAVRTASALWVPSPAVARFA